MTDKLVELFEEGEPEPRATHARPRRAANCSDMSILAAPPVAGGAAERARTIMTDTSRPAPRPPAVLGGLRRRCGRRVRRAVAAARAGRQDVDRRRPRPSASRSTARPIAAFRARPARREALRRSWSSAAGWCSTSPSPHFGGWSGLVMERGRQKPACHLRRRQLVHGRHRLRRQRGRAAWRVRASGRCSAATAARSSDKREQDAEARRAARGHPAERHAAHRLRAPASHRPLRDPRRRGAGADRHLKLPADAKRMRANQGLEGARGAAGRARYKGSVVAFAERLHARQRLSHRLDLGRRRRPQQLPAAGYRRLRHHRRGGLPDGGLLVLERSFRWSEGVKMRLRHHRGGRDRARRAHRRPHADRRPTAASRSTTWKASPCTAAPAARPSCR